MIIIYLLVLAFVVIYYYMHPSLWVNMPVGKMSCCPKCGSNDVKWLDRYDLHIRRSLIRSRMEGERYSRHFEGRFECQNCKYRWDNELTSDEKWKLFVSAFFRKEVLSVIVLSILLAGFAIYSQQWYTSSGSKTRTYEEAVREYYYKLEHDMEFLDEQVKKELGEETEPLGTDENKNDIRLYRIYSIRDESEPVYFWLEATDQKENNLSSQLMKSDAVSFWRAKDREVWLVSEDGGTERALSDISIDRNHVYDEPLFLSISCESEDDLEACAEDMQEWLLYAAEDSRYFWENPSSSYVQPSSFSGNEHPLLYFEIRLGELRFFVSLPGNLLDENEGDIPMVRQLFTEIKQSYFRQYPEKNDGSLINGMLKEDWIKTFLTDYQDNYDQECALENGKIIYRLVALDGMKGKYWYILIKSTDFGESWDVMNTDPFPDTELVTCGEMVFTDADNGYMTSVYSDMINNRYVTDLYVTEDGGVTFVLEK